MVILGSEYPLQFGAYISLYSRIYWRKKLCNRRVYSDVYNTNQNPDKTQTGEWCVGSEGVIGQGGIWKSAKNDSLSMMQLL